MYSPSQVLDGVRNPRRILDELTRLRWRLYNSVQRRRGYQSPRMMAREWDTLVVLDACRFDIFDSNHDLGGALDRHYSLASNTAEWLEKSFAGRTFPDTVYVTASPKYLRQELQACFHDIVPVWQHHWEDDLRTVPPDVMTARVLAAHERYPHKRIIAHYIQPHIPFIGETGRSIPHEVIFAQTVIREDTDQQNFWTALEAGNIEDEDAWRAYVENLELALPHVERLLKEVQGRTVVTADHGNVFGEHGLYGHPAYRHVPELITVPWLVHEQGPRRDIEHGEVRSQNEHYAAATGTEEVQRRLTNLGYLDG